MSDSGKTKLPKQIGGVKLPKKVRKQANKALGALDQPLVRRLASVALAAASAAAAKHVEAGPKKTPEAPGEAQAKSSKKTPASATGPIGEIAAGLALAAITKWLTPKKVAAEKPAEPAPAAEAASTPAPKPRTRASRKAPASARRKAQPKAPKA